ncbi:MAG: diacylglycerol kinase family lipid kinase [Firmicutes bacterium]|nr:diacylglycerol kinase family lipid kinase [Bacillota bacterium]
MAIVNPASANRTTGRVWPSISTRLRRSGLEHDCAVTSGPGEATLLTRRALQDGYKTIIAVGGDGTTNEVVNGFFDGDRFLGEGARLGLISRGTGRDLVRTLGIPRDEDQAVERLRTGRTRRVDLGRVEFVGHDGTRQVRYFINVGDLGLGGDTVARVNRTTKAFGGFVSFLWGTLATVASYRNKDLVVTVDDQEVARGRMCIVVVANGQYFGGGMRIAPLAVMDDGLFDVVVVGDLGRLELVLNIAKVYRGAHLDHPKVRMWRGRTVGIRGAQPALLDLDGEQPGRTDAIFTLLPGLLDVIV